MDAPAAPAPAADNLAQLIYVELVGRAFLRSENAAVFKPDPAELARLSIELAAAFHNAQKAASAAAGPKNVGYDLQISDLSTWKK